VVVADPLSAAGLEMLAERFDVFSPDPKSLNAVVGDADALIVRSRTKVTGNLLDAAPKLRLVARAGIGVDNIDVEAATERGILVVNAPLGNVRSTAEHTVALIFALARRVPQADSAVREGLWKEGYDGVQLAGKRLGVLGAGKVGRQVASIARGIGMDVLAYDPFLTPDDWRAIGLEQAGFEDVVRTADFLTLHMPLDPSTRGLIGAPELAQMKPTAFLVNCARGGLVDENALADALESRRLAGAALDVFASEPLRDSRLLSTPNTILTPHVAASTREAQAQVSLDVAEQVIDFFSGKPSAFVINPQVLELKENRKQLCRT